VPAAVPPKQPHLLGGPTSSSLPSCNSAYLKRPIHPPRRPSLPQQRRHLHHKRHHFLLQTSEPLPVVQSAASHSSPSSRLWSGTFAVLGGEAAGSREATRTDRSPRDGTENLSRFEMEAKHLNELPGDGRPHEAGTTQVYEMHAEPSELPGDDVMNHIAAGGREPGREPVR